MNLLFWFNLNFQSCRRTFDAFAGFTLLYFASSTFSQVPTTPGSNHCMDFTSAGSKSLPRFVIVTGGLMIGTGLIAASWVTSVTALTIVYGVIFGLGVGLTYVSTISNAIKFFPDHRGLAGGLATMAYGLSSMIVPPVAGWLISGSGIDVCLQALGSAGAAVLISAGLLTRKPSDHLSEELGLTATDSAPSKAVSLNWKAMLSTRTFWPMLLFFITGSTGAMMLFSCVASIAQNAVGLTTSTAAGAVSVLALPNTVGRFAAGTVSDVLRRLCRHLSGVHR